MEERKLNMFFQKLLSVPSKRLTRRLPDVFQAARKIWKTAAAKDKKQAVETTLK